MAASVEVALDTRAPVLTIDAPAQVSPPEPWTVIIDSSEDVGSASASFVDSIGTTTALGLEQVGRRILLTVPTVGVSSGPGTLVLRVSDEVLNTTLTTLAVVIDRPVSYRVELTLDGAYEQDLSLGGAFSTVLELDRAHAVNLEIS